MPCRRQYPYSHSPARTETPQAKGKVLSWCCHSCRQNPPCPYQYLRKAPHRSDLTLLPYIGTPPTPYLCCKIFRSFPWSPQRDAAALHILCSDVPSYHRSQRRRADSASWSVRRCWRTSFWCCQAVPSCTSYTAVCGVTA